MIKSANIIFILILAFFGAAAFWLSITEIDEVVRAEGLVEPEGKVQTVQPLFGSIVEKIHVRVGDHVVAEQLLITLNDAEATAQLAENLSLLDTLRAEIARLNAEVKLEEKVNWPEGLYENLVIGQQNLFLLRRQKLQQQGAVLHEELRLIKNRIQDGQQKNKGLARLRQLKLDERGIYEPLVSTGAEPRVRLIAIDQEVQRMDNEISSNESVIRESEIELSRNAEQRKELVITFQSQAYEVLAAKQNEREAIRTKTNALRERVLANELRSPVSGVVTKVNPTGVGAVVRSGEPVVEVVPNSTKIIVRANLQPKDINTLKIGQPSRVLLTSYDFTVYGSLLGNVTEIAQNTTISETGETYYTVWIECPTAKLTKSDIIPEIIPGMLVQVEITGKKRSVLDYLLKPVRETTSRAFTET